MRRRSGPSALVMLAALALLGASPRPAAAVSGKCIAAIIKASAVFAQKRITILTKCETAVVKGKLPGVTDCHVAPKTVSALDKAATKLHGALVKSCGGKDKSCGSGDDDAL